MDEARATGNPVLEVHRRAAVAARHSQQAKLSRDLWRAGWSKSSPGEIPVEHPSNLLTTMDRADCAPPQIRAQLPYLLQCPLIALTFVSKPGTPPPHGWAPPPSADEWYTREQAAAMMSHAGARLFASALPPRGDATALRDGTVVAHMVKMLRVIVDGAAVEGSILVARGGHLHVLDGVLLMVGTSEQRSATGVTLPSATVSIPGAARGAGGAAKQLTVGVPVIVSAWLGGVAAVYERRERAAYRVRDDLRVEPNDVSGRTSLYLKRAMTAGAGAALLAPR